MRCFLVLSLLASGLSSAAGGARPAVQPLLAGAAKVDITNTEAGPVNDPLYVKALVLKSGATTAVIVTVDAVAIAEIGSIRNDFLAKVRARIKKELGIEPAGVLINASHCHGVVCSDIEERTFRAVEAAAKKLVPVRAGVGVGFEDRVMENRRLKLKSGKEVDVRHAYSLPPDEEVAEVGPIDPTIGVLRLDRNDGKTLAVVYNFACHPIQGVPSGGNTADMTGFASRVIENNMGDGAIALFVQGCAGDINPARYKETHSPRDAETLGNLLGLSTLRAAHKIKTAPGVPLKVINEMLTLPRADLAQRIDRMLVEQTKLLRSLQGTSLSFQTFMPLYVKYQLSPQFPSYSSHRYLHEKMLGREELNKLDADNRRNMKAYIDNIYTMEQLTRLQTNLALLRKHHARNAAAGKRTIDVELVGLRVGDFVLLTFPGELTVPIGLSIKKHSPHKHTFVAGYTNGYIFYAPTAQQLKNVGGAQEDSDCLLAPEWHRLFEDRAAAMLKKL